MKRAGRFAEAQFGATLSTMPSRPESPRRSRTHRIALRVVVAQGVLYAAFMVAYFHGVLMLLGNWLKRLSDQGLWLYAIVALALIVVQSALLEALSNALQRSIRRWLP